MCARARACGCGERERDLTNNIKGVFAVKLMCNEDSLYYLLLVIFCLVFHHNFGINQSSLSLKDEIRKVLKKWTKIQKKFDKTTQNLIRTDAPIYFLSLVIFFVVIFAFQPLLVVAND